jgi:adenosylhomocysteine nucleosidase
MPKGAASPQVLVTGAGEKAAYCSVSALLARGDVKQLIICGYCGAISNVPVGTVVLPCRVINGYANEKSQVLTPDPALLAAIDSSLHPGVLRDVTLLSCSRVLLNRDEKLEAASRHNLQHPSAVDMETVACARAAAEFNVPWIVIRVVTDSLDDTMPLDFNQLNDGNGQTSVLRIVLAAIAKPSSFGGLIQLGGRAKAGTRLLHDALHQLGVTYGPPA